MHRGLIVVHGVILLLLYHYRVLLVLHEPPRVAVAYIHHRLQVLSALTVPTACCSEFERVCLGTLRPHLLRQLHLRRFHGILLLETSLEPLLILQIPGHFVLRIDHYLLSRIHNFLFFLVLLIFVFLFVYVCHVLLKLLLDVRI